MKRYLQISIMAIAAVVLLASCSKRDHHNDDDKESGIVTSDYSYYSVVKLVDTYAFIETLEEDENFWPYEGDRLRGTFYDNMDNRVYNITGDNYITVQVHGFYDTERQAEIAIENYIDNYGTAKRQKIQSIEKSTPRIRKLIK